MVWCGMVNVDLYSAIITKVSNALDTLVSGEKPGFQTLPEGLVVLLCAEVVRQRVPDHGAVHIIIIIIIIFIYHTRTEHKIRKLNSVHNILYEILPEELQLIELAAYANQTKLFNMNCNNNNDNKRQ